jgi:hypothetical protein
MGGDLSLLHADDIRYCFGKDVLRSLGIRLDLLPELPRGDIVDL